MGRIVAVPVGDAWDVSNVDDIAHAAENAVRHRASCPRRRSILVHGLERLRGLLCSDIISFPLLGFQVLLRPLLLDIEAPKEEDNNRNKGDTSHHASSDCAHIWT